MALLIIDRRQQGKQKSAVNRQRFLKRFRKHIKEAVSDAVSKRSITDMERGEEISIPKKDISEPIFHQGKGGKQRRVLPGNKEFIRGDRIDRPSGGGGGAGGKASSQGEGMDEFVFELNQQEFLDFMFEDLELPNLVRKQLKDSDSYKLVKGGYLREGIPARLNVLQSLRGAKARRIALSGAIRREIKALEKSLEEIGNDEESEERRDITVKLDRARRRLNQIPFLDDFDLRYNHMIQQPTPTTSAVMFCLMDVSGSMTQDIKDLAKRFFVLLHLFLKRHYEKTEVVFIRHHTKADEVDEEEFFYSRETGGTVVSTALDLMQRIVRERYPSDSWNIYAAQASDGENWADDSPKCRDLLVKSLLPLVQYFAYVEISSGRDQELWQTYSEIPTDFPDRFAMRKVSEPADIFPVFRDLFERRSS
ncbi:MAG: YeaH/YhbH family protein [Gammaproteobacteria bacterium]|nr:YeaH/YhbH family protein [Gammaproteobacteria bacterium]MDH3373759.1 YeaH/YhbH family protein [Gammaproteobacteria bacterium]MDH3408809.1 YeaH/YhbH family protein [Gammaproteobacteria bacterium]